ncbi:SOS response-associated peptidase [Trichocoleus sp. ST-U3]|uniref:SOS response-associated peptidase n=1 Tax=Cyanophyceae TaxID=3028117 RepID=UPI00168435BF|nr:SOS response-associated peptidase [Coleofasciculus sp. FACHB-542]MBD2085292.1 SOS response-associated peptidase [Coleofasciculus sp. FACHB-542]
MCGRFTQSKSAETIAQAFQVNDVPLLMPRYNIAPTQSVQTVLQNPEQSQRQFKMLHWGLIPRWAKDTKMGAKLINARVETVAEKPAFRAAFKQRRCLVVADGFYEWKQQDGKKQPFYCRVNDGQPFGFAGLWEHWEGEDGEEIDSCTILTTEPNEVMRPIHNRMPVILDPKDYDLWLDSQVQKPELLQPLLRPYSAEEMATYPVSTKVNKPMNDTAELINSL